MSKTIPNANDILADLIKKPEPAPDPTAVETPAATPTEIPAATETPGKADVKPEPVKTEIRIDDWDNTEPEKPTEVKWDFQTFVKDTGIEAKDEVEFKEKIKALKSPVDVFDGVDERLKKAVEFAKKGGDPLQYLGIQKVDYSKIDPIQLYEQSVLNNKTFTPEEAKELLESQSPLQKKAQGIQLQAQYTHWQNAQISEYEASIATAEAQKAERKIRADRELKMTLDKVEAIAGFSLKPHHKTDIYDAITTGRMGRDLFYDSKTGEYDYQSMIETYFLKKNKDKILETLSKRVASDTLRNYHKEIANSTVDKPKELPEPVAEKPKSQIDKYLDSLVARNMGKKST